jgi:PTS system N-acetylglucosamine-specific IIC component
VKGLLASLQRVGGALMLPIAVLPIAGLLLRFGQPDLLASPAMVAHFGNLGAMFAAAGGAIFDNLGLLFAAGVAVGLARENHGAAGLAGVVAYLVATKGAEVLISVPDAQVADLAGRARDLGIAAYKAKELSKLTVPVGILSGLMAGGLYNRFYNITLPSYLSFFGGRRFVPIVSGFAGVGLAIVFGTQWQRLEAGMDAVSQMVLHAGALGLFVYGVLNRLLIVTGLHHIINYIPWFLLGDYHGVTGEVHRFTSGDPTAGAFMAGFFPVMMFGLPAACLAMYHTALPERRRIVGSLLGSIALTSFLTGITEPIEFTFIFLAPALYAVHALLTGVAFVIMSALHVHLGFNFSAGLIDYVLNYRYATRPLLLLPVGALYFAIYYFLFRFVIVRFDLRTPGRDPAEAAPATAAPAPGQRAIDYLAALGGAANIVALDACATRLRLRVADQAAVDTAALKRLGAAGFVRPGPDALQVVVGPVADQLASEMRAALRTAGAPGAASAAGGTRGSSVPSAIRPSAGGAGTGVDAARLLAALGGRANVRAVEAVAGRLRVSVGDTGRVDTQAVRALGLRGLALPAPGVAHVLTGPGAAEAAAAIEHLLK